MTDEHKPIKLTIYFKTIDCMHFDNIRSFAIKGDNDKVLRIDDKNGKTHFINFDEVVACIEEDNDD